MVVLTLEELLNKEIPPRKNLLAPWLPSQGLCMIYSKRGLGKTWLALEIAYAVSSGGNFLNWEAESPLGVLYIDGEMPLSLMKERLSQIENSRGKKIGNLFKILNILLTFLTLLFSISESLSCIKDKGISPST